MLLALASELYWICDCTGENKDVCIRRPSSISVVNENRILFSYNTSIKIQINGRHKLLTIERSGTNNNYVCKHSVIFDVLLQGVDWKHILTIVGKILLLMIIAIYFIHILVVWHIWSLKKFAISRTWWYCNQQVC